MKLPSADIRLARVGSYVFLSWSSDAEPALTEAELATVTLALAGRKNREIAAERKVSVRTVANQLAGAYRKLGVASRFGLLARARRSAT